VFTKHTYKQTERKFNCRDLSQQHQHQYQKMKHHHNQHPHHLHLHLHQNQQDFGLLVASDCLDTSPGHCMATTIAFKSARGPDKLPVGYNYEAVHELISAFEAYKTTKSDGDLKDSTCFTYSTSNSRFEPIRRIKNAEPPKKFFRQNKAAVQRGACLNP
jgi:hypothetical protein